MPRGAGRGGDPRCRGRLRGAPGGVPGGCRRDLFATRGREGSGWTVRLPVGGPMTEDLLTLVIPTYNGPDFLERALRYYAAQQVRCPIVVADSSPSPAADANRRAVDTRRPVLTIRYERYEPEIHVAQKIARALEDVPSPYAALGADDDFSIPASLERGAAFLASHPDYAMARGEAALVHLAPADDGRSIEAVRYLQRGIEGSTGTARLLDHLAHRGGPGARLRVCRAAALLPFGDPRQVQTAGRALPGPTRARGANLGQPSAGSIGMDRGFALVRAAGCVSAGAG